MIIPRLYSLNVHIYRTAVLSTVNMSIIPPILIYLTTGYLSLLTTFIQFSLPSPTASGNHKLDLFFYEFGFCEVGVFLFVLFFGGGALDSTYKWNQTVFVLSFFLTVGKNILTLKDYYTL